MGPCRRTGAMGAASFRQKRGHFHPYDMRKVRLCTFKVTATDFSEGTANLVVNVQRYCFPYILESPTFNTKHQTLCLLERLPLLLLLLLALRLYTCLCCRQQHKFVDCQSGHPFALAFNAGRYCAPATKQQGLS
jgi:hypothetical protein